MLLTVLKYLGFLLACIPGVVERKNDYRTWYPKHNDSNTKMRKAEHHKAVTDRPSYLRFKIRVGCQVVGAAGLTCYSHCAFQYNLLECLKHSWSGMMEWWDTN